MPPPIDSALDARIVRIRFLADDLLRLHWDRATGIAIVEQIITDAKAAVDLLTDEGVHNS